MYLFCNRNGVHELGGRGRGGGAFDAHCHSTRSSASPSADDPGKFLGHIFTEREPRSVILREKKITTCQIHLGGKV